MENHTNVDQIFVALADPTRRNVVEILGDGPRRAGELARATGTSPARMSRHLRVLLDAGIADDERPRSDARARVFRLRTDAMTPIHIWLDQLQAHWDAQLESFKQHVDNRSRQ